MHEKVEFEYSPLGEVLNNKAKNKTDQTDKIDKTDKRDKNVIYNSQHGFLKFRDISDFKEMPFDSMHKRLQNVYKKFAGLKQFSPQTNKN